MNAVLNTVLGRGLLIDERLPVRNLRTGEERFAMFKPFANGGEYGDAHGNCPPPHARTHAHDAFPPAPFPPMGCAG